MILDPDSDAQANRTLGSIEVTSISSPISYATTGASAADTDDRHHHHHNPRSHAKRHSASSSSFSRHEGSNGGFSTAAVAAAAAVPHSLRRTPMFLPISGTPGNSSSSATGVASHPAATAGVPHHLSSSLRAHHPSLQQQHAGSNSSHASSQHQLHSNQRRHPSTHETDGSSGSGSGIHSNGLGSSALNANMIKSGLYPVSGESLFL